MQAWRGCQANQNYCTYLGTIFIYFVQSEEAPVQRCCGDCERENVGAGAEHQHRGYKLLHSLLTGTELDSANHIRQQDINT